MANNYIQISSISSSVFYISCSNKRWDGTIEYSKDISSWSVWEGRQLTINSGEILYLRGIGNTRFSAIDQWNYSPFGIYCYPGQDIKISGNIENLLDYQLVQNNQHPTVSDCAFYRCFYYNTHIKDVSELDCSTVQLSQHCFAEAFCRCYSLISPPILGTTTSYRCYYYMFSECRSLVNPPLLSATNLSRDCYTRMFEQCTSLTTAPELPATTLADSCYNFMFSECTSLLSMPQLPATTLDSYCYCGMFYKCTSLVNVTELPATNIGNTLSYCYDEMFSGCTALTTTPKISATSLGSTGCCAGMFYNCTSLVNITNLPDCNSSSCFPRMFYGCTSLKTLPSLQSNYFPYDSCNSMFYGCSNLKLSSIQTGFYTKPYRIPVSGNATALSNAFTNMFTNTGGTFTGTPTVNTTYYLYDPPKLTLSTSNKKFSIETFVEPGWNGTMEYSLDGNTWSVWDGNRIQSGPDYKIYLRGIGNTTLGGQHNNRFKFMYAYPVECSGMIDALLDYQMLENGQIPPMDNACFRYLFFSAPLSSAPTFMNRSLTAECYSAMFMRCSNLIVPPALPSTTLANKCYSYMFDDCTSLTTTPELPALETYEECYYEMFMGCTGLTSVSPIRATSFADRCCQEMFQTCTSLITAPELYAQTVGVRSCSGMFYNCQSLVTGPTTLPATILGNYCYYGMFEECTALTIPPSLSATELSSYCYGYMFGNCTSLTTPPTMLGTTVSNYSCQRMFNGCTSLVKTPKFNFTNSAEGCWCDMFMNCTSLIYPADITVAGIADYACEYMYNGCSSLKISTTQTSLYTRSFRIPTSGTGTAGRYAFYNMFQNTGGTFTGSPSINTTYYVYEVPALTFSSNNSFTLSVYNSTKNWDGTLQYSQDEVNWTAWDGTTMLNSNSDYKLFLRGIGNTVITGSSSRRQFVLSGAAVSCSGNIESLLDYSTVEQGNHPVMGNYAFGGLFADQSALISSPLLSSITLSSHCYYFMFHGCTSLTTAPELPAMQLTTFGYGQMFEECTSLTTAPELPATALADYCYDSMFSRCGNLTTPPPLLPAETLYSYSYEFMFYLCRNLTTAPIISAINLASGCCDSMFKSCWMLQSAPELPATTLAECCYQSMFNQCIWLTIPPELPATTLAHSCYKQMFSGSYRLTKLPELPATDLPDSCYQSMFSACLGIKLYNDGHILGKPYRIPTEGTGTIGTDSLTDMFLSTGGDNIGTPTINTTYYYPAMVTVSAQYGDETLFSYNQMSDQLYDRIIYDDEIQSADNWMGTKIFNTVNTIMSSHFIVGLKALLCSNKVMDKNITVTSTWAS